MGWYTHFIGAPALGQVQRIKAVGEGSHNVHRVVNDERRRFVSARHAGRKRERKLQVFYVSRINLIERAESRARVILRWTSPLPIIRLELSLIRMSLIVLLGLRLQHGIGLRNRYTAEVKPNREKGCNDSRRKN